MWSFSEVFLSSSSSIELRELFILVCLPSTPSRMLPLLVSSVLEQLSNNQMINRQVTTKQQHVANREKNVLTSYSYKILGQSHHTNPHHPVLRDAEFTKHTMYSLSRGLPVPIIICNDMHIIAYVNGNLQWNNNTCAGHRCKYKVHTYDTYQVKH